MCLRRFSMMLVASASIAATGCHSAQELTDPRLSLKTKQQQPQFLDNISLGSNSTTISIAGKLPGTGNKNIDPAVSNVLQMKYALLMEVVPNAISNMQLYNFIEDWYGVRYRLGGNDRSGIDCSAFVQRLYESVFCTNLVRTALEQFNTCHLVFQKDSLAEGDLVFFRTRGKKRITHVGIYLINNFFVHASSSHGVTISSLNEHYWSRFYAGAGRVLQPENRF